VVGLEHSVTYGETVVLHSRTASGRDSLGNDTFTTVDTTITGCGFDPGGSVELVQGQVLVTTTPTLYAPTGTVVNPIDQVTVRGVLHDVDGGSNDWRSPLTGWSPGVAVKLKVVTG
jgi:hypothetical protein